MSRYALVKDNAYTNVIIADTEFVNSVIASGTADFAIELEDGAATPTPGDPIPVYYTPSDMENWVTEPSDLRSAVDILASRPSFAVDKGDANDQAISGVEWVKVQANRLLWTSGYYDLEQSWFTVPTNGVYNHDLQLRVNGLTNVANIEFALFMRVDGVTDDYWFTLAKAYPTAEMTEVHVGNSTQFDFYEGETYHMAVKLTPVDDQLECSATILGSDDFTAWGSGWVSPIINGYRSE